MVLQREDTRWATGRFARGLVRTPFRTEAPRQGAVQRRHCCAHKDQRCQASKWLTETGPAALRFGAGKWRDLPKDKRPAAIH
jgi:hypothetical protein